MRKSWFLAPIAGLLAIIATPAAAQDTPLSCMAGVYTEAEDQRLKQLGPQADFASDGDDPASAQIAELVGVSVDRCRVQRGWSEEVMVYAFLYELGRVMEYGYRRSGQLSGEQLGQIDTALATGDRSRLWEIVEREAMNGLNGRPQSQASMLDAMVLGSFVIGSGLENTQETGEKVGFLLGMMALQRVAAREFAAASEGN